MKVWDGHLADPHLPQTLGRKLADAGFEDLSVVPIVQFETEYDPSGTSAILLEAIVTPRLCRHDFLLLIFVVQFIVVLHCHCLCTCSDGSHT